jgi:hypothetical protein
MSAVQQLQPVPETPSEADLLRGVLGAGCARPGKYNLRLIRRAIREGWPIPPEQRAVLVAHLTAIIESGHARNSIAAARCLLAAARANGGREARER